MQIDVINYGIIDATYKENGNKCRLTLAKHTVGQVKASVATALTKHSPYTNVINQQ